MAAPIRQILGVTYRWALAWAIIGIVIGFLMMLDKTPPIAEPGAPKNISFYSFWIPLMGVGGGVYGLMLGFVFATLMAFTQRWRTSVEVGRSVVSRYGPPLLCGAAAGLITGLPITQTGFVLMFVVFGICSALVSTILDRRTINKDREALHHP
jgi:uncharacterized membrane protein YfcA